LIICICLPSGTGIAVTIETKQIKLKNQTTTYKLIFLSQYLPDLPRRGAAIPAGGAAACLPWARAAGPAGGGAARHPVAAAPADSPAPVSRVKGAADPPVSSSTWHKGLVFKYFGSCFKIIDWLAQNCGLSQSFYISTVPS